MMTPHLIEHLRAQRVAFLILLPLVFALGLSHLPYFTIMKNRKNLSLFSFIEYINKLTIRKIRNFRNRKIARAHVTFSLNYLSET